MPHRTIAFAHTAFLLLAALLTTLLLATWEMSLPTARHSASVRIVDDDGTSDSARIARTVEEVASERGVAIGFTTPDVNHPESLWHMYLAVGDPGSRHADWLTDGYPSFGHTLELRVHPMDEFAGPSTRGHYLVFGDPANARVLTEALAEHGLSPSVGATEARLWHSFLGGPLFNVLAVALLVGVTAISAGILLGSGDYAVQRLHGRSYGRILLGDLVRVARLWCVALPCVTAATLAFLGLYNGWNQLDLFCLVALAFVGIFTAAALVTHAAVLGVVHMTAVLPALGGRLPERTTQAGAYLVRVPVLLLVLSVLGSVVHLAQTTREQGAALEAFARTGQTSHVALSGGVGSDDFAAVDSLLGPWLREADRAGRVVIAELQAPGSLVPIGSRRPGFDVLVVNDTYLAEQEVVSPSGERYGPDSEGRVRVLLPGAHASHEAAIARTMPDWLRLQSGGEEVGADVEILPSADGQSLFTYGSNDPLGTTEIPFARDPVVVALPNGAVLSDGGYVTYMTHESVLFPDPGVVEEARESDPRMARYVKAVQPIVDKAAAAHASQLTLLRVEAFNLVAATAVLLLTGIAACVIHVRARAQTIFARHIGGWTFLATHRRFLAAEAAVSLGFVGWAAWDSLTTLRALRDPRVMLPPELVPTTGLEPLYAVAIAATGLALTTGALAFFHRRIVREGSSRA
ncbi:hypothetical protein [Nocardiopsis halotolerans]|uniref:hypothetical protein n=1 Tax=Nocardiopsis halotolerans TaxID=124252 RepID=UPI00034773F2|nr:hypothetical protein [Nocardiopsis halotolerans]